MGSASRGRRLPRYGLSMSSTLHGSDSTVATANKTSRPMTTTDDPWVGLSPPDLAATISARRVDSELPWAFFWGCDGHGRPLLVLQHSRENSPRERLPRLRGLEMFVTEGSGDTLSSLVLQLDDESQRDVFHRLCLD